MNCYRTMCMMSILMITAGLVNAKELPLAPLKYDPFKQPAFLKPPAHTKKRITHVVKPRLELRSILQAGDESMVNLNGEILTIGDTYRGYKLVEVNKQSAVLEKNGRKIRVTLQQ